MEAMLNTIAHRSTHVSVIIPAHNEAKNLPYVLPQIPEWVHEVILVNDHSSDNTVEVARMLLPTVRVVHTHNRGKGVALKTGFEAVTGDMIVTLDADGSNDPRDIQHFVDALLGGAYFALGSRLSAEGGSEDITQIRQCGARFLIAVANGLFQMHFSDMFCGMNAFWRDCLDIFHIDCEGFEIETLMILRACKANLKIAEVPCFEHARIHGTSNFRTLRDGWRVFRTIFKEWLIGRSVIETIKAPRTYLLNNGQWEVLAISEHATIKQ